MVTGQAIVDAEVRELVRRRGIDPVVEPDVVARLVGDVISDYLDRAITSNLPPLAEPDGVARAVHDAIAGFGPLQPFLDDPSVDDFRTVTP